MKVNVPGVYWKMQSYIFSYNLRILQLHCYDMILEVGRMREFSLIIFDFTLPCISFTMDGREIKMMGQAKSNKLRRVSCNGLNKMIRKKWKSNVAAIFCVGR